MYPPNLNVPLPDPSALAPQQTLQPPDHLQQALSLITPLFALGTALGGSPMAGASVLHGAHQTLQKHDQERQLKAHQDAQLQLQWQQLAQQQQEHELARQQAMQKATVDLATQFSHVAAAAQTRDDYERGLQTFAGLASMTGLRMGPDQLRQAVPYIPPQMSDLVYKALDAMVKNPANKPALDSGDIAKTTIKIKDPETKQLIAIPFAKAVDLSNYPIAIGEDGVFLGEKDAKLTGNAAALYDGYKRTAKLEGRTITPEADIALQRKAIHDAAESAKIVVNTGATSADDTDTLAQMLVDGRAIPGMLSKRGSTYNATLARANKLSLAQTGKPMNLAKLQIDYEGAKRFVASMNGPNMIRFQGLAGSVVNTIDEVKRLGAELQQGGVQLFNNARRTTLLKVFGNTPQSETASEYLGAVNTLKEEFASLVQGGYSPTESAFALANQQVNGDFSLKDLNASLSEVQRLINYRIGAFNDLGPRGLGDQTPTDHGAEVWVRDKTGKLVKKGGGSAP